MFKHSSQCQGTLLLKITHLRQAKLYNINILRVYEICVKCVKKLIYYT